MTTTALTPARPVARPVASAIVAVTVVVLGILALIGIRLGDSQPQTTTPRLQVATGAPGGGHGAPGAAGKHGDAGLTGSSYSEWPPPAKASTTTPDRNHEAPVRGGLRHE